jgi:hypothetical protein
MPNSASGRNQAWLSGALRCSTYGTMSTPPHARGLRDLRRGSLLSRAGATSEVPLSDRQIKLLAVVAEGGGNWDARWIDLTVNSRYGPGEGTVLQELEALQRLGLVVRDHSRSGVGGRWMVTATARPYIQ